MEVASMKKKKLSDVLLEFSKDKLISLIEKCSSSREILIQLGFDRRHNFNALDKKLKSLGIDFRLFIQKKSKNISRISNDKIFCSHSHVCNSTLKKRIIKDSLLEHKCKKCGLEDSWNNLPIVLQIDHINGIRNDNRLDNLRFLCPNCHSQTTTYCSKNPRIKLKTIYCSCGNRKSLSAKTCMICRNKLYIKSTGKPDKELLEKLIWVKPAKEIGKTYNVSHVTVLDWCKEYGIVDKPTKGYWQRKDKRNTF
jgi:hypothetical protein